MRKMCNRFVLIFTVALASSTWAQEGKNLSLPEAIDLGLKNSKSLKVDQAVILQAQAKYLASKNAVLPDFKITGSAMALGTAKIDLMMMPAIPGKPNVSPQYATYGMANLSVPIYAGGQIKYGIESSKYLLEAAKLSSENDQTAIAFTIALSYNNLYKASQMIEVLKTNLTASQARDKMFLNQENNGALARNDRLKASLQTSNLELQLLDAQNQYEMATINMDLLLGLPESTTFILDPSYINAGLAVNDVRFYQQEALKNRKDLQVLAQQQNAAELGAKVAKAQNLPSVVLTAGYIAGKVDKTLSVYNATSVGLGVQYNLSNIWKKNTAELNAQGQLAQLNASSQLLEDQIKLSVQQDYKNYELANKRIDVLEQKVVQADENFRITKNKYNNGLETITNLLDADAAQIGAHIDVLNAKADAALAYRKLLQTSGTLISE